MLEFWKEILNAIWRCLPWMFIFAVPVLCLIIFYYLAGMANEVAEKTVNSQKRKNEKNPQQEKQTRKKQIGGFIAGAAAFQVILVLCLPALGKELYSPYDLYHYTSAMELSVKELGLFTSVRLDVKRLLFGIEEAPADFTADGWEVDVPADHITTEPIRIAEEVKVSVSPNEPTAGAFGGEKTEEQKPEDEAVTEKLIDRSPNSLNIDFEQLVKEAPKEEIATMHRYFSSVVPTNKNEYTGIFEGYNLILITAEGFSPYALDETLTPTLYRLSTKGFQFRNFYTPIWGASTTDGEYVACTGMIPKGGVWSMYQSGSNDMPFAFGNQFRKQGYECRAYHNHTYTYYHRDISHPNLGYDYKGLNNGLSLKESWPESDLEMMEVTVPEYINLEPFHTYYMTVSGHMNYTFLGNAMSYKRREEVKDLPYSEEAKAYLACNIELDQALEHLISSLTVAGIADRTVIALSADHYPYGLPKESLNELAGHQVEDNFEIYRNSFFLWTASMKEPVFVDKAASSLDIAPTLSNLFGLPFDSRLYMGRDIFSDAPPLVIFSNRSFISDKVMYNSKTKEVTLLTEESLPEDYIGTMNKVINNKFKFSAEVLENNYNQYILPYLPEE